jgi:RNA 2',3'-cyclic 3'-phosphodiesterase
VVRLFVALPLPPSALYAQVAGEVAAAAPNARLAVLDAPHVTLRFLGDVPDPAPVAAALDAACAGRLALPCIVEGLGTFPSGGFPPDQRARIVWAGVRAPGIEALAAAVQDATAGFGSPPETRPFVAHVTLARLPRPTDLRRLVHQHHGTLFAEGTLDHVVLFRSTLGPGGPRYEELHAVDLAA